MKIKVESFGGIVGHMEGERSSSELSVEQLSAIDKLRGQPVEPTLPGPTPRYRVTVTDDHGVHELEVPEKDMPDALTSIPTPKL